jgi:hypothetical protein
MNRVVRQRYSPRTIPIWNARPFRPFRGCRILHLQRQLPGSADQQRFIRQIRRSGGRHDYAAGSAAEHQLAAETYQARFPVLAQLR